MNYRALCRHFIISIPATALLWVLVSCSSASVYRIETTSGIRLYSRDKPELNEKTGYYELIDLDGNEYQIKDSLLYKIEPYNPQKP